MKNMFRKCPWCSEVKSVSQLVWPHAKTQHFWGRFACSECPFMGDFAKNLVEHVKAKHPKQASIKCPTCKKQSPLNEAESHYKECITGIWERVRQKNNLDKKSREVCDTCGKSITRNKMRDHKRRHHNDGEVEFLHCDKCNNKYVSRTGLRNHMMQAHDNVTFNCSTCNIDFDTKYKLFAHQRKAHSTEKEFECQHCGLRFHAVSLRKKHEMSHEAPQFQCSHCPKKLASVKALEIHERYHTGEKPFKCTMCPNEFVSKSRLFQHTRGVHKVAGPRGGKLGWKQKQK